MLRVKRVSDGGRIDGAGVKCVVNLVRNWNEDPHGRSTFRQETDIKMSLRGVVYKDVTLAHVYRERHHCKTVMNAVMTLQIVQKIGILLTTW